MGVHNKYPHVGYQGIWTCKQEKNTHQHVTDTREEQQAETKHRQDKSKVHKPAPEAPNINFELDKPNFQNNSGNTLL